MQVINEHQKWGNVGNEIYYNWLLDKTKNNEGYHFELLATVDKFAAYDLMQIKRNVEDYSIEDIQYIEIKIRNIDISDYEDCTVDIEKITKLQKLSLMTGSKCFLAAIYKVNKKIAIWQIEADAEYQTRETTAIWHTAAPQWGKKTKIMAVLPLKDAKIYNYQ